MIQKRKTLLLALLILCGITWAEQSVTIPITEDVAIGSEPLLDYVTSVNDASLDTLFVCNFSC